MDVSAGAMLGGSLVEMEGSYVKHQNCDIQIVMGAQWICAISMLLFALPTNSLP